MILSLLIAVSCHRQYDCYFISDNLVSPYYPYYTGQKIQFHNGEGDTLAYTVDIKKEEGATQLHYGSEGLCKRIVSYFLLSKNHYNITLKYSNISESPLNTTFCFECCFQKTNSDRTEAYFFGDCGNDRYFKKHIGENIPYDNPSNNRKLIRDIVHKKDKGLVSFYDVDNNCTWYLVEQ